METSLSRLVQLYRLIVRPITTTDMALALIEERIVDDIIIYLRRYFDVIVFNAMEPFVDPRNQQTILYRYKAKKCNKRDGWNGRQMIGESHLISNAAEAKRQACIRAIDWLILQNCPKTT